MTPATHPHCVLKPLVAALCLTLLDATAQTVTPLPGAGILLQQVQPSATPLPQERRSALEVRTSEVSALPASAPFEVKRLRIVGNHAFSTDTLAALVADAQGQRLSLPQLSSLAARITGHYQRHGYPLSRAIVPAQTIRDGEVVLQVLEAQYGAVTLANSSAVSDGLLQASLTPLVSGAAVGSPSLDRALLLLSDVPGVGVLATLKPGAAVGSADLVIRSYPNPPAFADLALDNFGNRYIGRARLSGAFTIANPLHRGDLLNIGLATSGHGMRYGRLSYELLMNGAGTRVGAAYSTVRYELGDDVRDLDVHGSASVASGWLRHPLVRAKDANLYARLGYEHKRLRDRIGVTDTRTDRNLSNLTVSVNGDWRDLLGSGGVSAWSLAWTGGDLHFIDPDAALADAYSARSRGHFSHLNTELSHIQPLASRTTLHLALAAQWARRNLDSAEKLSVGGPYTVRAYDVGAVSADAGVNATIELRQRFGAGWQAIAFVDSARVKINRHPWFSSENQATLSGAGLGLIWQGPAAWRASATLAHRIGAVPALAGSQAQWRAWASLNKGF